MTIFLALLQKIVYYTAKWRKSEIRKKSLHPAKQTKKGNSSQEHISFGTETCT